MSDTQDTWALSLTHAHLPTNAQVRFVGFGPPDFLAWQGSRIRHIGRVKACRHCMPGEFGPRILKDEKPFPHVCRSKEPSQNIGQFIHLFPKKVCTMCFSLLRAQLCAWSILHLCAHTHIRKNANCFDVAIATFFWAHQWPLRKLQTTN